MNPDRVQKFANSVTRWIGSPISIAVHTFIFLSCFAAVYIGSIAWDEMLLVLTTIVSLEAIYLSLFIQMTVNFQAQSIAEVGKDIDEIQEDVDEIQEDVGEIQEDIDELQEDVEDISEDVEEMNEEEEKEDEEDILERKTLETIQSDLRKLMADIQTLRNAHHPPAQNSSQ